VQLSLGRRLALVVLVAVSDGRQKLRRLIWSETEPLQVVVADQTASCRSIIQLVEVAQFCLYGVGAQESVGNKRARQLAVHYVVTKLETKQIAGDLLLQHVWFRRIELNFEVEHRLFGGHVALQLRLDLLLMVEPELHIVYIPIRQAEVLLLDELQVQADERHEIFAQRVLVDVEVLDALVQIDHLAPVSALGDERHARFLCLACAVEKVLADGGRQVLAGAFRLVQVA